jgi:molybdenum-dependent DNA-binding transcriptional regulator ModE
MAEVNQIFSVLVVTKDTGGGKKTKANRFQIGCSYISSFKLKKE